LHFVCEIGKNFYSRGWAPGTGGNYSIVSTQQPLQLAITASGMDKGALTLSDILLIDEQCEVIHGTHRPSYESLLHVAVVRARAAGAVFHTHSVPATILSQQYAIRDGWGMS
jgi:methylthioribulose-1-phosphate dehydratase